ncbi:hypothetical protein Q1695_010570 [Nippostrongylus brasiliensis]|nr:hypothetical protein Q1695_010570 [Nippostrongylus brasiliensis]
MFSPRIPGNVAAKIIDVVALWPELSPVEASQPDSPSDLLLCHKLPFSTPRNRTGSSLDCKGALKEALPIEESVNPFKQQL